MERQYHHHPGGGWKKKKKVHQHHYPSQIRIPSHLPHCPMHRRAMGHCPPIHLRISKRIWDRDRNVFHVPRVIEQCLAIRPSQNDRTNQCVVATNSAGPRSGVSNAICLARMLPDDRPRSRCGRGPPVATGATPQNLELDAVAFLASMLLLLLQSLLPLLLFLLLLLLFLFLPVAPVQHQSSLPTPWN